MSKPSRTATTVWRSLRRQALQRAHREQLTDCPLCGVRLDYERSRQPNSAEADHIMPHALGGEDVLGNVRIICRACNRRRGQDVAAELRRRQRTRTVPRLTPPTAMDW